MTPNAPEPMTLQEKFEWWRSYALGLASKVEDALDQASSVDGAHHKAWVIDQMVRALTGDGYEQWVANYEHCGKVPCSTHDGGRSDWDCDEGYGWDEGIAP